MNAVAIGSLSIFATICSFLPFPSTRLHGERFDTSRVYDTKTRRFSAIGFSNRIF